MCEINIENVFNDKLWKLVFPFINQIGGSN